MGTLIDTLEETGGASAIWNEFEVRVKAVGWRDGFPPGWLVDVKDYRVIADQESRQHGMRPQIVINHLITSWDELAGLLAELGVPDAFDGWR